MPNKYRKAKTSEIRQCSPEKAFDVYDYFTDEYVYYGIQLGKY